MKKIFFLCFAVFLYINIAYSQMSGIYYIDSQGSGDYLSVEQATNDLKTQTITGDVTFILKYSSPVAKSEYGGKIILDNLANNGYKITFKGELINDRPSVTINSFITAEQNFIVSLNNLQNIVFQDLIITGIFSNGINGHIINVGENCSNIHFVNCDIVNNLFAYENTKDLATVAHNNTSVFPTSYVFFDRCLIKGGSIGILWESTVEEEKLFITNSSFENQCYIGAHLVNQKDATISKNILQSFQDNSILYAIKLDNCLSNNNISANTINIGGLNLTSHAIDIYNCNSVESAFTNNIVNNVIYHNNTSQSTTSINIENSYHTNIIYNTINLLGDINSTTVNVKNSTYNSSTHLQNNIFVNNGYGTAYIYDFIDNSYTSSNNIFYSKSSETIVRISNSLLYNMEQLTSSTMESNSYFALPNFISEADNNFKLGEFSIAESAALPVLDINTDFEGKQRNLSTPDIGAYEGNYIKPFQGTIAQDTTWENDIYISGDVIVPLGKTLQISSGVTVKIGEGVRFIIHGQIFAYGTKHAPIIFEPTNYNWHGFYLDNPNSNDISFFQNAYISNTYNYDNIKNRQYVTKAAITSSAENLVIRNCKFSYNNSDTGAAIYASAGKLVIFANLFETNSSSNVGGAIYLSADVRTQISNNIFFDNSASNSGGAIRIENITNDVKIINNTFFNNKSYGYEIIANAISGVFDLANVYLYNNILFSDQENAMLLIASDYQFIAYNNLISNIAASLIYTTAESAGNITGAPFLDNNLKLLPNSPCIDKGNELLNINIPYYDFDENLRIVNSIIDIGAHEYQGIYANAGEDQKICDNYTTLTVNTLNENEVGEFVILYGTATIEMVSSNVINVTNLSEGVNILVWNVYNILTSASVSDEIIIKVIKPYAYAGEDQYLVSTYQDGLITNTTLIPNAITNNQYGLWTTTEGTGNITTNPTSGSNEAAVSNMSHGINRFIWKVLESGCYTEDEVIVYTGYSVVSTSVVDMNWNDANAWVSNFVPTAGDSVTIYNARLNITEDAKCAILVVGNAAEVNLKGATAPATLTTNRIILEESATKFGSAKGLVNFNIDNANLILTNEADANAPALFIGSGASMTVGGTPSVVKSEDNVIVANGGSVVIQQTAEKSDAKSTANLIISDGGSVIIQQTAEKSKAKGDGELVIGNGGSVVIQQTAEKSEPGNLTVNSGSVIIQQTAEKSDPGVMLVNGGSVIIQQTAEKSKNQGVLNINNGILIVQKSTQTAAPGTLTVNDGSVIIQQTAEKSLTKAENNLIIADGGSVIIQQTAEKNTAKEVTNLVIQDGGSVIIQQTAEKSDSPNLVVDGGSVIIQQTAEKAAEPTLTVEGGSVIIQQTAEKSGKNGEQLEINGGSVIIQQTAEKISSTVEVPFISIINNSKLIVGTPNSTATTGTATIYTRGIEMTQIVSEFQSYTPTLYIAANGIITKNILQETEIVDNLFGDNAKITIEEGGALDIFNNPLTTVYFDANASLIDYNENNYINARLERTFNIGESMYFSTPFETTNVSEFSLFANVNAWNEKSSTWNLLSPTANVLAMQGTFITPLQYSHKLLKGILNSGNETALISSESENPILKGVNAMSNPFHSAIDLEKVYLNDYLHNSFYSINKITGAMTVYQQGGITINEAKQYILPTEVFFVQTSANTEFILDKNAQVHHMEIPAKQEKVFTDMIKLKVQNNLVSDETVIRFLEDATDKVEPKYDAIKITAEQPQATQIYSLTQDMKYAINTLNYPNEKSEILLTFKSPLTGNYTIEANQLFFSEDINIYLKDLSNNKLTNLRIEVCNFDYLVANQEYNFVIQFSGFVGIEDRTNNLNEIKVYTQDNNIYFDSQNSFEYQIYDLNGKLLDNNVFSSGINSVSKLYPSGIYIVKTISQNQTYTHKILITQ